MPDIWTTSPGDKIESPASNIGYLMFPELDHRSIRTTGSPLYAKTWHAVCADNHTRVNGYLTCPYAQTSNRRSIDAETTTNHCLICAAGCLRRRRVRAERNQSGTDQGGQFGQGQYDNNQYGNQPIPGQDSQYGNDHVFDLAELVSGVGRQYRPALEIFLASSILSSFICLSPSMRGGCGFLSDPECWSGDLPEATQAAGCGVTSRLPPASGTRVVRCKSLVSVPRER
jgi:hypothetical protein